MQHFLYRTQRERCEMLAQYIVEHRATVRQAAQAHAISKSTVHKDVTVRLKNLNPALYRAAKIILDENKSERHLRGGEATKQKYLKKKQAF